MSNLNTQLTKAVAAATRAKGETEISRAFCIVGLRDELARLPLMFAEIGRKEPRKLAFRLSDLAEIVRKPDGSKDGAAMTGKANAVLTSVFGIDDVSEARHVRQMLDNVFPAALWLHRNPEEAKAVNVSARGILSVPFGMAFDAVDAKGKVTPEFRKACDVVRIVASAKGKAEPEEGDLAGMVAALMVPCDGRASPYGRNPTSLQVVTRLRRRAVDEGLVPASDKRETDTEYTDAGVRLLDALRFVGEQVAAWNNPEGEPLAAWSPELDAEIDRLLPVFTYYVAHRNDAD
jgi:hypothetical protein